MNKIKRLFILSCTLPFLLGCQITTSLDAMYEKDVEPQKYAYGDKSIIFVPLVHYGEKIFFNSLRDSIVEWKENGYTIFYEQISNKNLDRTERNLCFLKWRKINGRVSSTRDDYELLNEVFKSKITQPKYSQLGIDSTDINADIGFGELIDKYEDIYGEVIIDSCDYSTPLDSIYHCGEGLKQDLKPITLDYRNEQLAERNKYD